MKSMLSVCISVCQSNIILRNSSLVFTDFVHVVKSFYYLNIDIAQFWEKIPFCPDLGK